MPNTKDIGILSELKVITELVEMGFIVSQPYGDNAPYDFIVDTGDKVLKVQVKTGIEQADGSIRIPLVKRVGAKRIGRQPYYLLNVDAVIAYSRRYKEFYYIDLKKWTNEEIFLRPKSSVKRMIKSINIAEDFLLHNLI